MNLHRIFSKKGPLSRNSSLIPLTKSEFKPPIALIVIEATSLWQRLGHGESLAHVPWPSYDTALCIENTVTVAVQVNGKLRATLELPRGAEQADVQAAALADERISRQVIGGTIRKVIHVKDKLLNLVVA